MKMRPSLLAATFTLACLWPLPNVRAVSPSPDGGYPGGNTAEGYLSVASLTTGFYNTGVGIYSLLSITDGDFCTGVGAGALFANTGDQNTAIGAGALFSNTTGTGNTANGTFALFSNSTAQGSTAVGTEAEADLSRRYKHDIKPMEKASEVLYGLKPVRFRYNREYDATQTLAFGLIAEEVAEVAPDLVGRNPKGEPESVRYEQINALLLYEFLKEHKAFLEEQSKVLKLEAALEAVNARLKEQDAKMKK